MINILLDDAILCCAYHVENSQDVADVQTFSFNLGETIVKNYIFHFKIKQLQ